mgnify:CR=1 FL=1
MKKYQIELPIINNKVTYNSVKWPILESFVKIIGHINKNISFVSAKRIDDVSSKDLTDTNKIDNKLKELDIKHTTEHMGIYIKHKKPLKCHICGKSGVSKGLYLHNSNVWDSGIIHYIEKHNLKPSKSFVEFIYIEGSNLKKPKNNRLMGSIKNKYVKIGAKQMMIMDALMENGGYTKRYMDNEGLEFRYSEHSGVLDFNGSYLTRVIVSGNTTRVDEGDTTIYLPENMRGEKDYKYMFHTHPPTPKPGSRASEGILYEFPSVDDIDNFVDKNSSGKVIGSIVITPEGLYNVRQLNMTNGKSTSRDLVTDYMQDVLDKVQDSAIKKYGTKISKNIFYTKISQDIKYIGMVNNALKRFNLYIDYFPRSPGKNGKWIIDDVFLPN